jgi:hypothetical protein
MAQKVLKDARRLSGLNDFLLEKRARPKPRFGRSWEVNSDRLTVSGSIGIHCRIPFAEPMFDPDLALPVVGAAVAKAFVAPWLNRILISHAAIGTVRSAGPAIFRHHL